MNPIFINAVGTPPHLPVAQVATTAAADYLALLTPAQEGVL